MGNSKGRNCRRLMRKVCRYGLICFFALVIYLIVSVFVVNVIVIVGNMIEKNSENSTIETSIYETIVSPFNTLQIVEGAVITEQEEAVKEDLNEEIETVTQSEVDLVQETETENKDSVSEKEVYLLAQAMTCEGESLSSDERMAIGQVILNRVNSDWSDFQNVNTIAEVLAQKGQYTETWQKIQNGKVPTSESLEEARKLLEMNNNGEIYSYQGYSMQGVLWQCSNKLEINLNMSLVELCDFSGTYHDFYRLTA